MPFTTSGFISRARFAAAHPYPPRTPVTHPKGVIVPDDPFMTTKLRDPSYVPYCVKRSACGRVRRTEFGFECPTCGNRMNFDLTHYDGNANVKYEQQTITTSTEANQ